MSKPSGFNNAVTLILDSLKLYFEKHSHDETTSDTSNIFTTILKATIIKSYEFSASINQYNEEHIFFSIPTLRGICEEYITEKFIFEVLYDDKDEIVLLRHLHDHYTSSIAQWKYFEANRPDQILYYENDFPEKLKNVDSKLENIIRSKIPNLKKGSVFPSVYYMSKQTELQEFYNYLYHATSTFVHFNPNNLLRMGWGDFPDVQFSAANFKSYYKDFSLFYSLMLLCKLCQWQYDNGFLPEFDVDNIKAMDVVLEKAARWPELVTFEEMNIGIMTKLLKYKSPSNA